MIDPFKPNAWSHRSGPVYQHRATLIQYVGELLAIIQEPVRSLLEPHASSGVSEEDVVLWVIAEEIQRVHLLFDEKHTQRRHAHPHQQIYYQLNDYLPFNLDRLISHYVQVPRLYGDDHVVEIRLDRTDLYIDYYEQPKPLR